MGPMTVVFSPDSVSWSVYRFPLPWRGTDKGRREACVCDKHSGSGTLVAFSVSEMNCKLKLDE